ncbi:MULTISPECIES: glycosyltransferase [Lacticaseibacillus]|uniref:Glycosyl transferase family 1 n=2 Tax=Lacticaseibacillus TaxID=2759736 RepID=A0AAN1EZJ6_LACCA|nr:MULTISPECIES: glycosyltransferase [Lacticaseibacillus]ARY92012.1 glycosyl transferase family 1 [Lacticaseibacillus casei]KAB1971060.1 glycosyltransferase family 1 protein [Lacticaseibacillus casei]WLV79913.1 glycosyltransferase [Lacticaseibacillus sp. NCIMB 15473]WNX23873.1 glycosyltransferase [Lacticaseibacillus casei]WNX26648.1 glycosyltransferase [Lacticaseibacillus casei]
MTKVLVVADFLPASGVTTFIENAFLVKEKGFVFSGLAISGSTENEQLFESAGWSFYSVPPANKSYVKHLKGWFNFTKHHKKDFDIVYFNYSASWNILPLIFCKIIMRAKIVVHGHNTYFGTEVHGLKKSVLKFLHVIGKYFAAMFLINAFVAVSEEAARWMFPSYVLKKGSAQIIPNGIVLEKYAFNPEVRSRVRSEWGLDGATVFATIGVLEMRKNVSFALDVFYAILKQEPNSVLLVVGEGTQRTMLEQKAAKLGMKDNVHFLGRQKKLEDLYNGIDVLLFPSLNEGLSFTLIEAQENSLPIYVSSRVPLGRHLPNLIHVLDLKRSADFWSKKIILTKKHRRINETKRMSEIGYNHIEMRNRVLEVLRGLYRGE